MECASVSACSLLGIPVWLGIKQNLIVMCNVSRRNIADKTGCTDCLRDNEFWSQ